VSHDTRGRPNRSHAGTIADLSTLFGEIGLTTNLLTDFQDHVVYGTRFAVGLESRRAPVRLSQGACLRATMKSTKLKSREWLRRELPTSNRIADAGGGVLGRGPDRRLGVVVAFEFPGADVVNDRSRFGCRSVHEMGSRLKLKASGFQVQCCVRLVAKE
jgi:hypothetical protein